MRKITVDFDGVIHSYISGWKGVDVIPDPPVKGAFEWLEAMLNSEDFWPMIYSSRSKEPEGILAMKRWFTSHGFSRVEELDFPTQKPAAYVTLDDRAITFRGTFPSEVELKSFRPWTAGFVNEIMNEIDKADEADDVVEQSNEMLIDAAGPDAVMRLIKAVENGEDLDWNNCAIEFEQTFHKEGYVVNVVSNNGPIIQTHVHLFEWSGYVCPFINEKNAAGLVKYLADLNRIDPREETLIRGEKICQ